MDNLEILEKALEYMEQHLEEEIRTEDIAANCYCSKSTLEKIFRFVNHISVRDYLIRRRMTKAARLLVECPGSGILDVALRFGYSSHEAFTRAFRQIWNCSPSEYRLKTWTWELFPRLNTPLESGDAYMNHRRILEAMRRMEDAAGEEDIVFRIGGDEFVLLTASEKEEYAGEKIARCSELFTGLQEALDNAKTRFGYPGMS